MNYAMGLLSGTSMDGIDAAIMDMTTGLSVAALTHTYSTKTQHLLSAFLNSTQTTLALIQELHRAIGEDFALAAINLIKKSSIDRKNILIIGSHGQTVEHNIEASTPYTVQLGCPYVIAERTGIAVASDFRTRDVLLGGQGAPFAPWYHQELFGKLHKNLAVVNIGGIANVSFIHDEKVTGYDIGPGNCLLDAWFAKHHGSNYDKNGDWASTGKILPLLLQRFLQDDFIKKASPKSIGKEYFSLNWLENFLNGDEKPEDVQATLAALTAKSIADVVNDSRLKVDEVLMCGGGVHNLYLMNLLSEYLHPIPVYSTEQYDIDPDFIEAMMFAALAIYRLENRQVDLRSITGASRKAVLGALYSPD